MNVEIMIHMIHILPKNKKMAINSAEVRDAFYIKRPDVRSIKDGSKNTNIRRNLDTMIKLGLIAVVYTDGCLKSNPKTDRYFLKETRLMQYFMNSKVAMNVIWSNNIMKMLGPLLDSDYVVGTAQSTLLSENEKTLMAKIRIVPDGIARDYATVNHEVLSTIISALQNGYMLLFKYTDRQGNDVLDDEDELGRAILGLVAKDGTLYLITCMGFDDAPIHTPLQRIKSAREIGRRTFQRSDFNLDDYIERQHQLAHALKDQESPVDMILKVAPEALFHFRERPIAGGQEITGPGADGRYTVAVTVPFTIMLPPFIWSHAGWVEVVAPASLRKYVAKEILAAAEHYNNDGINSPLSAKPEMTI